MKHNLPVAILGGPPPPRGDPVFGLKPLPDTLKYAYLDEKKIYPVIISANLSEKEEEKLLKPLKKHRAAIGYTLDDLKGISLTLCQHKINLEADAKPVRDPQRFLDRVGTTPLSPTLTWRQFQMSSRNGVKNHLFRTDAHQCSKYCSKGSLGGTATEARPIISSLLGNSLSWGCLRNLVKLKS